MVGIYSPSGCGKTWSSLLLARGFVGPKGTIGMVESEGGRGESFVGRSPVGDYVVRPIRQTFSPQAYGEAIREAEDAKLDALIIDSASHEWEGAGGVLAMAAANQAAGKKGVLVWQQPKIDHQRHFMLKLMQTPIPLCIVTMRARYPMVEDPKRGWIRSDKLEPKQADDILFEMFCHLWLDQEHRAHVTKYTLPELKDVIIDNQPITLDTGVRLAAWARADTSSPRRSVLSGEEAGAAASSSADADKLAGLQASEPVPASDPAGRSPPASPGATPVAARGAAPFDLLVEAREAADRGTETFQTFWKRINQTQRSAVQVISEELRSRMNAAAKEEADGGDPGAHPASV